MILFEILHLKFISFIAEYTQISIFIQVIFFLSLQMSRKQQKRKYKSRFIIVLFIIILLALCFNFLTYSIYGVNLHFPPTHDSPKVCEDQGFQICTTAIGTCTRDKKKCADPEYQENCKYVAYEMNWDRKKYFNTHPKVKQQKLSEQQLNEIKKVYKRFCGSQKLALYHYINQNGQNMGLILEILLTAIIFFILYPQIRRIIV